MRIQYLRSTWRERPLHFHFSDWREHINEGLEYTYTNSAVVVSLFRNKFDFFFACWQSFQPPELLVGGADKIAKRGAHARWNIGSDLVYTTCDWSEWVEPSTSISKVPSRVYLITQENPLLVYLTNEGISSVWRGSQLENSNENALGMMAFSDGALWTFHYCNTAYSHSFDRRERVNSSSVSSSSSSNPRISYEFHWLFLLPVPFCPIPSHPLLWFVREISDDVMIKRNAL